MTSLPHSLVLKQLSKTPKSTQEIAQTIALTDSRGREKHPSRETVRFRLWGLYYANKVDFWYVGKTMMWVKI